MSQIKQTQSPSLMVWFIWGIAGLYVLFQFMLQASTSIMVNPLKCDLSINETQVGFLSSSFFYTYLILQIPAGILADRLGIKRLLLYAIGLCGIACIIFGLASNEWIAGLARLLMGMASAPGVVCAMCLACRFFPPAMFALLAGMVEMLGMLGGAIGQSLLAQFVAWWGWRVTMLICAAMAVVLLLLVWKWIPRREQGHAEGCAEPDPKQSVWVSLKKVVTLPQVWICSFYSGLMFSVVTAFAALWAVPFLQTLYHQDTSHVSWMSALLFIGTGLGAPLSGGLAERMGRFKPVMLGAALFAVLFYSLILYGPVWPEPIMALWFFLLGLMSGVYATPFALVKKQTCDTVKGTALGFANMMCILFGAPILQPLMGWWLESGQANRCVQGLGQHYLGALSLLTATLVLAVIVVFFIKEPKAKKEI